MAGGAGGRSIGQQAAQVYAQGGSLTPNQSAAYQARANAQMPQQQQAMPQPSMPTMQPAISPMQQYMQSIGINRAPMDYGKFYNAGGENYARWRAPQTFQPQLRPNMAQSSAAPKPAPQQSEMDKMREELDQLRAWREQSTGYQGNSN